MSDTNVSYDGDADTSRLEIHLSSVGIRIEIETDKPHHFHALHEEIFGDPDSLAGWVYRQVLQKETDSGLTVEEVIESARQANASDN